MNVQPALSVVPSTTRLWLAASMSPPAAALKTPSHQSLTSRRKRNGSSPNPVVTAVSQAVRTTVSRLVSITTSHVETVDSFCEHAKGGTSLRVRSPHLDRPFNREMAPVRPGARIRHCPHPVDANTGWRRSRYAEWHPKHPSRSSVYLVSTPDQSRASAALTSSVAVLWTLLSKRTKF